MGLLINVYRNQTMGDCTNKGVSSEFDTFCVSNVEGPFEPSDECPELLLREGPYKTVRLIPAYLYNSHIHYMFGGNYGATSDSRFGQAIDKITGNRMSGDIVKIFDRVE